jgi:hypothetical protein
MKSGVPLVSMEYYTDHNANVPPVLRAAFLSGLNTYVEQTFSDEIEAFEMTNFKIVFLSRRLPHLPIEKVQSYCIGDKKLNLKNANRLLTEVLEEFIAQYGHLKELKGNLSRYHPFKAVIEKKLGDLTRSPDDRVRSVF